MSDSDEARLQLLIGSDIADAVDPAHTDDQRVAAVVRLLKRDPEMALAMTAALLTGVIEEELDSFVPGGTTKAMRLMRARFAQM